ncbi:MAG: hypothetical protein ABJH04_07350 [Cyclobacteriaceae bacterium]
MKTNKKQNRINFYANVVIIVLLLLPQFANAQGSSQPIVNAFKNFITAYWPVVQIVLGLAGGYCLINVIAGIFFKGDQGGSQKLVWFLFGAILLWAAPFILSAMFGLSIGTT